MAGLVVFSERATRDVQRRFRKLERIEFPKGILDGDPYSRSRFPPKAGAAEVSLATLQADTAANAIVTVNQVDDSKVPTGDTIENVKNTTTQTLLAGTVVIVYSIAGAANKGMIPAELEDCPDNDPQPLI